MTGSLAMGVACPFRKAVLLGCVVLSHLSRAFVRAESDGSALFDGVDLIAARFSRSDQGAVTDLLGISTIINAA